MSITINSYFNFSHIKGIIFDLDGTLADSNPNFAGLRAELGIAPNTDILAYIESITDPALALHTQKVVTRYELESSNNAQWIAGAEQLVAFFKQQQLPQAILTRNMPEAAQITLGNLGINVGVDIDPLLTRFDAKAKPHPQGVELICQQWRINTDEILFIGDYLFDIQTANNAGSRSVLYSPNLMPEYAASANIVCGCYLSLIEHFKQQLT